MRAVKSCTNSKCFKSSAFTLQIKADTLINGFLVAYKKRIGEMEASLQDADSVDSAGALLAPYSYLVDKWNNDFVHRHHPHIGLTNHALLSPKPLDPPETNGDRTVQLSCIKQSSKTVLLRNL